MLIGLFDPADPRHLTAAAQVRRLRDERARFVIPVIVLSEALVASARQHPDAVITRRRQLRDAFGEARGVDEEIAVRAALLRSGHRSLRLPDALVIATGLVDDVDKILTTDKRWKGIDDRIHLLGEH